MGNPLFEPMLTQIFDNIYRHFAYLNELIVPWVIWMKFCVSGFQDNFSDW